MRAAGVRALTAHSISPVGGLNYGDMFSLYLSPGIKMDQEAIQQELLRDCCSALKEVKHGSDLVYLVMGSV